MKRNDKEGRTLSVAQANMATALANHLPAESLQGAHELRAGDNRQATAHTGTRSF